MATAAVICCRSCIARLVTSTRDDFKPERLGVEEFVFRAALGILKPRVHWPGLCYSTTMQEVTRWPPQFCC